MATDIASLDVFTDGVAQLLAPLTDDINDKEATTTVQFALQAAGTDVVKLQSLIDAIYDKVTPRDKCSARLIVKLWKAVPDIIGTTVNTEKGDVVKKSARLVRHYVLQKCQSEFPLGMETEVWSTKSIAVALAMWQADLEGLNTLIGCILHDMVESEDLFGHRNFESFAHACRTCGLMLEQDGEDDTLTRLSTEHGLGPLLKRMVTSSCSPGLLQAASVIGRLSSKRNHESSHLQEAISRSKCRPQSRPGPAQMSEHLLGLHT